MNDLNEERIHLYFDGMLNSDNEKHLGEWLKASSDNALQFAQLAKLHDRMPSIVKSREVAGKALVKRQSAKNRWALAGGMVAMLAGCILAIWWPMAGKLNASMALERLIEASDGLGDRAYLITNQDPEYIPADGRMPSIDGAMLYVRAPDMYVLVRRFHDGRTFVTGCDGERSWAVPPDGKVRVSADPMRFRGPIPGQQHGIPFVDLRSDLVQLRDAYTVRLESIQSNGWQALLAEKKSARQRGPRQLKLWFAPATGVIHRMVFEGMPQAQGGPRSVAVELQNQHALLPDFFHHTSHHGPDRNVVEEE